MSTTKRPRAKSPVQRERGATHRQGEFLAAVVLLTERLGHPPCNQEVADHMGVTRWGARRALVALEAKGLLSNVPKVVSSGQWALTETARAGR